MVRQEGRRATEEECKPKEWGKIAEEGKRAAAAPETALPTHTVRIVRTAGGREGRTDSCDGYAIDGLGKSIRSEST
jgi:hypothetical protein